MMFREIGLEDLADQRHAQTAGKNASAKVMPGSRLLQLCWVATNYDAAPTELNPSDSCVRFEFLEAIVRIGTAMYPPPSLKDDAAKVESVEKLLRFNILPQFRRRLGVQYCIRALNAAEHNFVSFVGLPGGREAEKKAAGLLALALKAKGKRTPEQEKAY